MIDVDGKLLNDEADDAFSFTLDVDGREVTKLVPASVRPHEIAGHVREALENEIRLDPPEAGAYAALFRGEEALGALSYDMDKKLIRWEPAE